MSTWTCETCATVIVNGPDVVDTRERFAGMFRLHAMTSPNCPEVSLVTTRNC